MLPEQVAHRKFRSFVPKRISNKPPTFGNPFGSKVSGNSIFATENDFYQIIEP
jgi:hypothetical protein